MLCAWSIDNKELKGTDSYIRGTEQDMRTMECNRTMKWNRTLGLWNAIRHEGHGLEGHRAPVVVDENMIIIQKKSAARETNTIIHSHTAECWSHKCCTSGGNLQHKQPYNYKSLFS